MPGESPETCAGRELEEETGMRAGRLERLTTIYTTPGFTDERIHLFLALELAPGAAAPRGGRVHGAAHAALVRSPAADDARVRSPTGRPSSASSSSSPSAGSGATASTTAGSDSPGARRGSPGRAARGRRLGPLRRLVQRLPLQREHHPARFRRGDRRGRRARRSGVLPADRPGVLGAVSHAGRLPHPVRNPRLSAAAHGGRAHDRVPDHARPRPGPRRPQRPRRPARGRARGRPAAAPADPRPHRGERRDPRERRRRGKRGPGRRARRGAGVVSRPGVPVRSRAHQDHGGRRRRGRHLRRVQRAARRRVLRAGGDPRVASPWARSRRSSSPAWSRR